jgi:hypothetical protein
MKTQRRPARNNRQIGAGLILAATLLGWAATRRRQQAPRTEARCPAGNPCHQIICF